MEKANMYTRRMAVAYENETPHATRIELGPYREADYLALPDEPRCELLYGRLPVMPTPSLRHQDVVGLLYRLLAEFAGRVGGRAFVSWFGAGLSSFGAGLSSFVEAGL